MASVWLFAYSDCKFQPNGCLTLTWMIMPKINKNVELGSIRY